MFNSLKTKLFLWYIGSLLLLTAVFFLFVHYWGIAYGVDLFFIIFFILTIFGFILIYRITSNISYLSKRISMISDKNLNERINNIKRKDEIGQLAINFNQLLDRLDFAFKREQRFIADVAHEMKTPIATLRSELEVSLRKPREKTEYQQVLKDAIVETDRLTSTLKNILDLAWVEAPNAQKRQEKINLSELMSELIEIAKKMAANKEILIKEELEKNIYIFGFKNRLAHAILNIIDNAIKYTPKNNKVEIILEKTPNKAIITVKDHGPGIKELEIPHIFDRFYRGEKTSKVFGAGLGLAIAKSIVNLHQGEIKVISKLNKGSSFIILLPI